MLLSGKWICLRVVLLQLVDVENQASCRDDSKQEDNAEGG
jgi:hypothetical protein